MPRILAVGDIRSGSTKCVGFAVGDGSLTVTCVHDEHSSAAPIQSPGLPLQE